ILAALSNQWFLWLLAWSHDLSSTAVLMALANIVAFSNPVIVGMENILVPEIARRRESLSFSGLLNLLRRRGLAAFLLITPPLLAVMVWPAMVLHLFYGAHRTYAQFTLPLQMLAGASAATLASFILSATLRGYRATGAVFRMQLYPALFGALLGSWLTLRFGIGGACLATLLAALLRAGIGAWYVARLRQAIAPAPESEAPMFRSADARQGA